MKIDYNNLKKHLETLCYNDFGNDFLVKYKIEKGISVREIEKFNMDKTIIRFSQVIDFNTPFLVDAIGNDLSIVFLTKRKYKLPTGRTIYGKFDRTIINDCKIQYGSCLNGYWKIPERFILND